MDKQGQHNTSEIYHNKQNRQIQIKHFLIGQRPSFLHRLFVHLQVSRPQGRHVFPIWDRFTNLKLLQLHNRSEGLEHEDSQRLRYEGIRHTLFHVTGMLLVTFCRKKFMFEKNVDESGTRGRGLKFS